MFYKGGARPPDDWSSYRPISLLDALAKLFERLVLYRIKEELAERGGLTIKQFGLRKGV